MPPRAPLRLAPWIFRLGCLGATLAPTGALRAQSLLDRPPNFAGTWVVRPGTVQFNFLHRFVRGDTPERKVSSFPTFVLATGVVPRVAVGLTYATNSQLVAGYPNEWEFFGRVAPLQQDAGQPLDVVAQAGYNLAAEGIDGELALGRRLGPVRALAALRSLSEPEVDGAGAGDDGGDLRAALAGGATIRLHPYVALAGDVATLLDRDDDLGEEIAWSAGLHLAIPNTPHTLSLQATNTNTATLQGASRGTDRTRYGFEFTIPVTLARYFGRRAQAPADTAPGKIAAVEDSTPAVTVPRQEVRQELRQEVRIPIRNMAFARTRVEVPAGTTVVWENADPLGHTATSDVPPAEPGGFDSGNIPPGGSWRHTFTRAGTYAYHCTPHPFMKATIVVR